MAASGRSRSEHAYVSGVFVSELATIAAAPMPRLLASVVDLLNAATRYRRVFGGQLPVLVPTQRIEHTCSCRLLRGRMCGTPRRSSRYTPGAPVPRWRITRRFWVRRMGVGPRNAATWDGQQPSRV
jgi:hypothetical protein